MKKLKGKTGYILVCRPKSGLIFVYLYHSGIEKELQMRKEIIIILLFISSFTVANGQSLVDELPTNQTYKEEAPPIRERLFYGGNFGLLFGTITDIQVSPVIGFWVLPRMALAIGPDYRYYNDRISKTHIYGGKAYMEFVVLRNINSVIPIGSNTNILFHLEDEALSLESAIWKEPPYTSKRFYINTVLTGGGIGQQIGRRSSMNFLVLWALNDNIGLYSNPEIRIIFNF